MLGGDGVGGVVAVGYVDGELVEVNGSGIPQTADELPQYTHAHVQTTQFDENHI